MRAHDVGCVGVSGATVNDPTIPIEQWKMQK
jgi:hypothetical protein